ncbi:hypothetical protein [Actinomadura sp. 3N508]|uniref:hypothetical protein n=1 Tax=Actinomadura sp. 3N508 TaxID=3375153 RepID=UPI0037A94D64
MSGIGAAQSAGDLPVPPLRLRRIRLHGVGPDGARFDPLDLDFTTRGGAAGRVLLSLTNTGGKSTLITLVSSLVVPAARAQMGGKNLGDFVLAGDTSHVVCEWEDATTATRTVTGTVMEWKDGRRQPGHRQRSTTRMHRAWYLFRTGPELPGIDDLPFVVNGRRTVFEKYVAALHELAANYPDAQSVLVRSQQEWTRALEERTSIDPVLFGYQMRMNDSEAGAEKLLATFDSPDNVIRFFVAALNDGREIADFTDKLRKYAELAARRPALEALNDFCTAVSPGMGLIADRAEAVEVAAARLVQARLRGGEHACALGNRLGQDRVTLQELEATLEDAAQEVVQARREYGQISDIRQQLLLEEARARYAAAKIEVQERTGSAEQASLEASAWDAVDAVLEVASRRVERDSAKLAYEAAEAGLGPLRTRVAEAAARLAGRLDGLAEEARGVAETADDRVATTRSESKRAFTAEKEAAKRLNNAKRTLQEIDAQVQTADNAGAAAMAGGWLAAGEPPEDCLRRWQEARGSAGRLAEQEKKRAESADKARSEIDGELEHLDDELFQLQRTAQADQNRLDAFDSDRAAVAAHEVVQTLLGGAPRSAANVSRAAKLAEQAAHAADRRAADHEGRASAARRELAHLDETGTAPTGQDVLTVLTALLHDRIGAVTGLEWIEHNIADPDARPEFIAAHPEIAGGVVVTDATKFPSAVERLMEVQPRTRTPITVTTTPTAVGAPNGAAQQRHIVLPHRETWDRQWAATTRAKLEETATTEGSAAAHARQSAKSYRKAAATCASFTDRWKEATREDLVSQADGSLSAVTSAERRRRNLRSERDRQRDAAHEARERAESARSDAERAYSRVSLATELVEVKTAARSATARRPAAETARIQAERDQNAAEAAREAAAETIDACIEEAAQARSARESWQRERDRLGVEHAASDPGGNLDTIRTTWQALRDELSTAERGMVEAELLDRAERALGTAHGRRRLFEEPVWKRAEVLATTTAASSRESLIGAQRRARDVSASREKERLAAEHRLKTAETDMRAAEPASGDRQNHIDLANVPEWSPASPRDIAALLERLEVHNVELRERRDAAEQAERDAVELRDAVAADVEAFVDLVAMWPGDRTPTDHVFTGSKDTARTMMHELLKAHRGADGAERAARDELREAVNAARAVANAPRWLGLDTPVATRIRSLREPDLVAEAEHLARRIKALAESASGDLKALDTHRSILRDGLLSLCREQRRLLREVSKLSRLPSGLGDLSGQATIKIRFEDAPDDEAAAHLATRIDSWATELAANPKRAASAETRARWLADAVRDTVLDRTRAGAWSIEILKPRIDGRVVHCPPDRIPHEFSGGQVLTLAVLVYCALSGVRSAHRPGGARPAGTLILDNPFGAASAEALIEMQHRLAAHTGLQLVCATGLNDANVDNAFTGPGSVIVKLRNDGDLRRNLSYLRLRTQVADGADITASITAGRSATAPQNWVDAVQYEIRQ